jgi:hypothetical protein
VVRKHCLFAGVALAIILPSAALAQESCEDRAANRAVGTVAGVVGGALIGSAIAGPHDRGAGAVVGGLAGGVIGNQLARGPRDCEHAYGWYDNEGRWHSNSIDRSAAVGYYDRDGVWVDGPPPDYYARDRYPAAVPADVGPADSWPGYPAFRDMEARIHGEIEGGVAEDLIQPDDARDLMHQLGDIEIQEATEYRNHGWNLPYDDRDRIRSELYQLDRRVDQTRAEP